MFSTMWSGDIPLSIMLRTLSREWRVPSTRGIPPRTVALLTMCGCSVRCTDVLDLAVAVMRCLLSGTTRHSWQFYFSAGDRVFSRQQRAYIGWDPLWDRPD